MKTFLMILLLILLLILLTPCVSLSQNLRDSVRNVEVSILDETRNRYEMIVVLDKNGNTILKKKGEKTKIDLTNKEIETIRGSFIITHNHPDSRGLSTEDMAMAIYLGVKEVRAIVTESIYGQGAWVMRNLINVNKNTSSFLAKKFTEEMIIGDTLQAEYFDALIKKHGVSSDIIKYTNAVLDMQRSEYTFLKRNNYIVLYFETIYGVKFPYNSALIKREWDLKSINIIDN